MMREKDAPEAFFQFSLEEYPDDHDGKQDSYDR